MLTYCHTSLYLILTKNVELKVFTNSFIFVLGHIAAGDGENTVTFVHSNAIEYMDL